MDETHPDSEGSVKDHFDRLALFYPLCLLSLASSRLIRYPRLGFILVRFLIVRSACVGGGPASKRIKKLGSDSVS